MEAEEITGERMHAPPATTKLTLENMPPMAGSSSPPLRRASYASSSHSGDLDASSSSRKRPLGSVADADPDDEPGKRMSYTLTEDLLDECDGLGDGQHPPPQPLQPPQSQQLPQPRPLPGRPARPLSASIALPVAHAPSAALAGSPSLGSMSKPPSPRSSAAAAPGRAPAQAAPQRADHKNVVASPQDFFADMLRARGYPGTTVCSLKCGYHNGPTKHQTTSYGVSLTKAIRASDVSSARSLLAAGLHPNACNKFGESIVHAACRRGDSPMLRALLAAGASVQVCDDFGRTPLHDACWTPSPCFDAIRILLDEDPWLLCVQDCRGSTPLGYVRKAHWAVWNGFLGAIADRYWPALEGLDDPPRDGTWPRPSRGRSPTDTPSLEVVALLANGKLTPEDAKAEGQNLRPEAFRDRENGNLPKVSRITLDPLRKGGENATTMTGNALAGSGGKAPLLQAYVQVTAGTQ